MSSSAPQVSSSAPDWTDLSIRAGRVFSPATPIDERSLFAGRDAHIRTVVDAINQKGQHAIIYGERGVGKTSLANVIHTFLGKQTFPVVAPRVQCDALDTFDKVWRRLFEKIELRVPVHTARLTGGTESRSFNATELLGGAEISPDGIRKAFTLLGKHAVCIAIIDEFDRLAPANRRPFADTIKTLSDHAVPATIVLVGVAESVDDLVQEHESIERAVVQVAMPRMSDAEVQQIITTGLDKLGMTIAPDALQRIVLLAQGLPHYAHLIGLYAARAGLDRQSLQITSGIVGDAIEKAVGGAQQSISSVWHQATRSAKKDTLFGDVLLACALAETDHQNAFAAPDVRGPLRAITGKPYEMARFAQHLNAFCEEERGGILERTGTKRKYRYRFANPLMQPFVIMQGFKRNQIPKSLLSRLSRKS